MDNYLARAIGMLYSLVHITVVPKRGHGYWGEEIKSMRLESNKEGQPILKTAAWTVSITLSNILFPLYLGYRSRDPLPEPLRVVEGEAGINELTLPTREFPDNLNQIISDYGNLSVESIQPGGPSTTVRFRGPSFVSNEE
jgi:hypothetical protein